MLQKTIPTRHREALQSLAPILQDTAYFSDHSSELSPCMRPQLECALKEAEFQLLPAGADRVAQIVSRLLMHYPPAPNAREGIFAHYCAVLANAPEDLLCAAYISFTRHSVTALPPSDAFQEFIGPELQRRRLTRQKLSLLLNTMESEAIA